MKLWILLLLAFIAQEPISTTGILLKVYQLHYNLWLIHSLFAVTTALDIAVGYGMGLFLDKRFGDTKIVVYLRKKLDDFKTFAGERGMVAALVLYSPLIFPLSAVFIPWLELSFIEASFFIFIGELIFWYGYVWLLVLGADSFASNAHEAFYVVVTVSLILTLSLAYFSKRASAKAE